MTFATSCPLTFFARNFNFSLTCSYLTIYFLKCLFISYLFDIFHFSLTADSYHTAASNGSLNSSRSGAGRFFITNPVQILAILRCNLILSKLSSNVRNP